MAACGFARDNPDMTESGWLTCRNPWVMVQHPKREGLDRKRRLFLCACCHRRLETICHPPLLIALLSAEQHIDNRASASEIRAATHTIIDNLQIADESPNGFGPITEVLDYISAPGKLAIPHVAFAADLIIESWLEESPQFDADKERAAQCDLIREIFGNPFRHSILNPAWPTATVVSLAQAIHDTGDFTRLPVLADAIEEAGCTDDALLRHCREPGQHVRGCWAVDLLLDK